jgi:glycosyltransferase involved in cell wall biosynthesis
MNNNKKVKVLFVLHLPPPVHGAAVMGSYIKESRYINETFECEFVNLSSSTRLDEIGKSGLKKKYQIIKILFKVIKELVSKKYDLVYMTLTACGPGFYKDLFVVALVKLFNVKLIYHFHNKGISNVKDTALNRFLYKFVFTNTTSILNSEFLYKDFARYLQRSKVFFCPYGIPVIDRATENSIPAKNSLPVTFLFLSNMMEEKGVFVLLDACAVLDKKGIEFKCDFVGAWSDINEDAFNKAVEDRGLSKRVSSHGKKYGEEKNLFFDTSDIFVFPTYYRNESFPVVILEAMQFYLPVISTYEGGIPDEIADGETGFLVPQCDSENLALKMELLIKDPVLRIKMGMAGNRRFKNYFTKEKFENNLGEILKIAGTKNEDSLGHRSDLQEQLTF